MKRTNYFQPQSTLDSFFEKLKRKKSVETPTTHPTANIEVTGPTDHIATTSAEASASIDIAAPVEHEITEPEPRVIMERDSQNTNSLDIVVPFSESGKILTETGPPTAEIAKTFSNQISNAWFINDIGNFVGKIIDDLTKKNLLESPWKPSAGYNMPHSVHMKKNKQEKRYLNHSHLEQYEWLVYSDSKKGLYCKYCSLFSYHLMAGSHKQIGLQKLVKQPLQVFAKLFGKDGDLTMHDKATYHKEAVESGRYFKKNYNEPALNIVNRVNTQRLQQVSENRQRLTPIVETVIFLGRQNIPFRGHRDDGNLLEIDDEDSDVMSNEGNFRELLKFRVSSGDANLKIHLKTARASATYISKTTQNALIECCGEEICEQILSRVRDSKYYAIMFDETTDASHKSQMTIILRYLMPGGSVREDFVGFVDLHDKNYQTEVTVSIHTEPILDGKIIGQSVINMLVNKFHLSLENCVGVGTDGCSVMSSLQKGAVVEMQKVAVNAVWCPCYNHALNLTLSKSSNVQAIRNCLGVISEVVAFFNASAKRNFVIKNMLNSQLVSLCETRWVERHDALLTFSVEFSQIIDALENIAKWNDRTTSSKARTLLSAIRESDFIVSLGCAVHVFSLTKGLSELFQKKFRFT